MPAGFSQTFPLAHGAALSSGKVKHYPEDFIVDEQLSFALSGTGEHVYLQIRKSQTNTHWLAKQLARHFGCNSKDIGYAGLKDRQALTTQWFSLPGKVFSDAKLAQFSHDGVEVVDVTRHSGKLRHGAIRQNGFKLKIRDVQVEENALTTRMAQIVAHGVPNYFGEQRFGIERQNLPAIDDWFRQQGKIDRFKRSIYLSAARAWLFNLILAERVRQGNWCQPLQGDVYMLEGSKRYFYEPQVNDEIEQRVREGDIHPTAPLWGEGELTTSDAARELEQGVLLEWQRWCHGLENARVKQQRRATRVLPRDLTFQLNGQQHELELQFALPAGCYATGLLREVISSLSGELELADE